MAFAADGRTLATGGADRLVKLWDRASGSLAATYNGHFGDVRSVAFDPAGTALASAGADGAVRIWKTKSGDRDPLLSVILPVGRNITNAVTTDDGNTLAIGLNDGTMELWDVASRQRLTTLQGRAGKIRSQVLSQDGGLLASRDQDSDVRVWDMAIGRERTSYGTQSGPIFRGVSADPIFTFDGSLLASAVHGSNGDDQVVFWHVNSGRPEGTEMRGSPWLSHATAGSWSCGSRTRRARRYSGT